MFLERMLTNPPVTDEVLDHLDIRACFEAAPDPYLVAARLLGARNPLVVEDSEAGVASGRATGFDVLRIPDPSLTARLVTAALDGANPR